MSILNRESAQRIVKKLRARLDKSAKAHDIAIIEENGLEIASFGLRRGKKDLGHDHIPKDIFVSPREATRLATCPMSREEWVKKLIEKGLIPKPESVN